MNFYLIPAVIHQKDKELSVRHRNSFLAAISRDHMSMKVLKNDHICSFQEKYDNTHTHRLAFNTSSSILGHQKKIPSITLNTVSSENLGQYE